MTEAPPDDQASSAATRPVKPRATDAEARALASAVRWRILRLVADEGLTNRQIADELEMNPATTLHHVRTLVDTGFVEAMEARRGRRGAREIPYRATGKTRNIDAGDITNPLIEAFLAEFSPTPIEQRTLMRAALTLSPEEMDEFVDKVGDLVEDFRQRPRAPDAKPWGVFVATHPSRRES